MKRLIALVVASALLGTMNSTRAQDPVKLSPKYYKVLLENEHVRVLEVRIKTGEKEPMHSHPAMAVYLFKDMKAKVGAPDGKLGEIEGKAGTALWAEPASHTFEVLSGENYALLFEMKNQKTTKAAPAKK